MKNTNTIHIFGYGETQVIGNEFNIKVSTSELKTVDAVISDINANKPTTATADDGKYHVITIYAGNTQYGSEKEGKEFNYSFETSLLNADNIKALVEEVDAVYAANEKGTALGITFEAPVAEETPAANESAAPSTPDEPKV